MKDGLGSLEFDFAKSFSFCIRQKDHGHEVLMIMGSVWCDSISEFRNAPTVVQELEVNLLFLYCTHPIFVQHATMIGKLFFFFV